MNDEIIAYASVLRLNREDIHALKIKDAYALHKVVYGLFEDLRSDAEKQSSIPSGIAYADKGGDFQTRQILMLSDRKPHQTPQFGKVQSTPINSGFLAHDRYSFEITINPSKRDKQSGKVVAIRGRDAIAAWFIAKAPQSWGFTVSAEHLQVGQISVQVFDKDVRTVTHGSATLVGELTVTDKDRFIRGFQTGIGRGRAFGFGLLQIVPL